MTKVGSLLLRCLGLAVALLICLVFRVPADAVQADDLLADRLVDGELVYSEVLTVPEVVWALEVTGESLSLRVKARGYTAGCSVAAYSLDSFGTPRFKHLAVVRMVDGQDLLLSVSGMDFEQYPEYGLFISTDYALFHARLLPGMIAQESVVDTTSAHRPLQLELPDSWSEIAQLNLYLNYVMPNGESVIAGGVSQNTLVPPGVYHVQLVAKTVTDSYALDQVHCDLSGSDRRIVFADDQVVELTVATELPTGIVDHSVNSWQIPDIPFCSYALYSAAWTRTQDGSFSCHVSKGNYERLCLSHSLTTSAATWLYEVATYDDLLEADRLLQHDLGSLRAEISPALANLPKGYTVDSGKLYLQDQSGLVWQIHTADRQPIYGQLTLLNPATNAVVFWGALIYGRLTLPNDLEGDYLLKYECCAGPVPVVPATLPVRISAPALPEIKGTVSLPDQQPADAPVTFRLSVLDHPECQTQGTILPGASCALYTLALPDSQAGYRLKYEIISGGADLILWGYLNDQGSSSIYPYQADWLYAGETLNITLPRSLALHDPIILSVNAPNAAVPSLRVVYQHPAGANGYYYQEMGEGDLGTHLEPTIGGWLVGFPSLDLDQYPAYYVGVSTDSALFVQTVTRASIGSVIPLTVGSGHVQLKLALPASIDHDPSISINKSDSADGPAWSCGVVRNNAFIPAGTYNVQVFGGHNVSPFSVYRANFVASGAESLLSFSDDELGTVLITVPDGAYVLCYAYPQGVHLGQTHGVNWLRHADGRSRFTLSKGIYDSIGFEVYKHNSCYLEEGNITVNEALDLGVFSLQFAFASEKRTFIAGETVEYDSETFAARDAAGRKWLVGGDWWFFPVAGQLRFAPQSGDAIIVPFVDGVATLPTVPGVYTMSYELPENQLGILPSQPVTVTILGADQFDLTGDGELNFEDLAELALDYGDSVLAGTLVNLALDFHPDGLIDLYDLVALARQL